MTSYKHHSTTNLPQSYTHKAHQKPIFKSLIANHICFLQNHKLPIVTHFSRILPLLVELTIIPNRKPTQITSFDLVNQKPNLDPQLTSGKFNLYTKLYIPWKISYWYANRYEITLHSTSDKISGCFGSFQTFQ